MDPFPDFGLFELLVASGAVVSALSIEQSMMTC